MAIKAQRILPSREADGTVGLGFFETEGEPEESSHLVHIEVTPAALGELYLILNDWSINDPERFGIHRSQSV